MSTINLNNSTSGSYNSHLEGKIEWSQVTDNTKNKSTITANIYVRKAADTTLTAATTGSWAWQIKIGSNTKTDTWSGSVLTSWVKVGSYSATLDHNTDGTLTTTISGYVSAPSGTSWEGRTTSGSGSAKLPTVPRASNIYSVSNCKAGSAPTVKWYPQSKDFYFDYKIEIGDYSTGWSEGYIAPKTTSLYSTSILAVAKSAASEISSSKTTATATVSLRTFDANKKLIDTATKTFTLSLPTDATPTDSITVEPVGSPAAYSNLYIQGKTKVKVTHSASAKYGASISDRSFSINSKSYSGSSATTGYLNINGTYKIKGAVTDSRGLVGYSSEKEVYFYPYTKPTLKAATGEKKIICVRCDDAGNPSDIGTRLKLKCAAGCSKIDGTNVPTLQIRCRPEGGSWTAWKTLAMTDNEYSGIVPNADISIYSTYDIEVKVTDVLGEKTVFPTSISTVFYTLHLRKGGRGVAIGKLSEKEAFECAMDAEFKGDVTIDGNLNKDILSFTWSDSNIVDYGRTQVIKNFPWMDVCFLKCYGKTARQLAAGSVYLIGTVPSGYRPSYTQPMSVFINTHKDADVWIESDGGVYIYAREAISSGTAIFCTGLWFT